MFFPRASPRLPFPRPRTCLECSPARSAGAVGSGPVCPRFFGPVPHPYLDDQCPIPKRDFRDFRALGGGRMSSPVVRTAGERADVLPTTPPPPTAHPSPSSTPNPEQHHVDPSSTSRCGWNDGRPSPPAAVGGRVDSLHPRRGVHPPRATYYGPSGIRSRPSARVDLSRPVLGSRSRGRWKQTLVLAHSRNPGYGVPT